MMYQFQRHLHSYFFKNFSL